MVLTVHGSGHVTPVVILGVANAAVWWIDAVGKLWYAVPVAAVPSVRQVEVAEVPAVAQDRLHRLADSLAAGHQRQPASGEWPEWEARVTEDESLLQLKEVAGVALCFGLHGPGLVETWPYVSSATSQASLRATTVAFDPLPTHGGAL